MDTGDAEALLISVVGTFLLTGKAALLSDEFMHRPLKILGVAYDIAVAVGVEILYPDIYTDPAAGIGAELRFKVHVNDYEILASGRTLYGDVIDMSNFHELTYPDIAEFGELDVFSDNADVLALVERSIRLMVIMLAFELRMTCAFSEEVCEATIQVSKGLL